MSAVESPGGGVRGTRFRNTASVIERTRMYFEEAHRRGLPATVTCRPLGLSPDDLPAGKLALEGVLGLLGAVPGQPDRAGNRG